MQVISTKSGRRWGFDRRITLAVVVTLFMQLAGALIWAAGLDARVGAMEERTSSVGSLAERFIRVEERLDYLKQDTEAIKRQLEFINGRTKK